LHFLFACILIMFVAFSSAFFRWKLLLEGQGVSFPFPQIVRYGMIGAFFNTTMPGAVSGDIIKAWYVISDNKGQKKTPVFSSILLDRVIGVFGLVVVAASPAFLAWDRIRDVPKLRHFATINILLFLAVMMFFLYLVLSNWGPLAALRRKMEKLEKFRGGQVFLQAYDSWIVYGSQPPVLFKAMLLSCFNHILSTTVVILCALALGDTTMSAYQYFLLVPMGLLTTAIPIAPAGLGVGHVAFAALFSLAGSTHGAEIFTMYVTISIGFNLLGIIFYLKSPKVQEMPST
jgi:uncharacterized protein (TIRG00374 family)